MFALVDGNNFFASCEQVFNPSLRNRPFVVLSNNDGCIIARSAEAKKLGIPMGVPFYEWEKVLRVNGGEWRSGNYPLYGDFSARLVEVLRELLPAVEVYSIDESFADVSGLDLQQLQVLGQQVKEAARRWLELPVAIGIAPTKTLAKLANQRAKKHAAHNGVCVWESAEEALAEAGDLPINDLWGVGRRNAVRLNAEGIHTVADLAAASGPFVRQRLSIIGYRLWQELHGISCLPLSLVHDPRKHIISSRSFGRYVTELKELEEAVATYTERAVRKLNSQGLLAQTMSVMLRTNKYAKNQPQKHASTWIGLPVAMSDTATLISYAKQAIGQIYEEGYAYNKAGIALCELVSTSGYQQSLLVPSPDKPALNQAITAINQRYNGRTIYHAACGINPAWAMRSQTRSPNYTTKWSEIKKIQ